ncbi:hypothetical protein BT69DRAFT_1290115 [Atractiella rhizophila]|nr:hypothetical protein BT69DRAFT_1290115 [Atractiella rhizophila]
MRTYDIRGAGSSHLPLVIPSVTLLQPAEEPGSDPTEGCINRFPISGHYGADPGELLETFAPVRQDGTPH